MDAATYKLNRVLQFLKFSGAAAPKSGMMEQGISPRNGTQEAKLIGRYTRAEMGRVWSEENKFRKWLEVELAATETLAEAGIVPREAAAKLRERARIDVARINEIEAKVKHDVIAFTVAVQESVARS